MSLILRFLHQLGFMCFGGFLLYDVFTVLFSSSFRFFSDVHLRLFYFATLPAFLLLLITGILLIVEKPYHLKKEKWLQKKFILSVIIMFVLILSVFPEMRRIAGMQSGQPGDISFSLPFRFLLPALIIILFLFIGLYISIRHRLVTEQKM